MTKKWLFFGLVILLCGILFTYLKVRNVLREGQVSVYQSNGRNILVSIFAREGSLMEIVNNPIRFPQSSGEYSFKSSTEYFKAICGDGKKSLEYKHFAGPGVLPCLDNNFSSENNAWSVVADIRDDMPPNTPFLISKNVQINSLDDKPVITHPEMLGNNLGVIVFIGAGSKAMELDALEDFLSELSLTNKVLRP